MFKHRKEELWEFAEFDPEEVIWDERQELKDKAENDKFDDERYVADLFSENRIEIKDIWDQPHPFSIYNKHIEEDIAKRIENLDLNADDEVLKKEEIEELLKLRNREYLIDKTSPNLLLQSIDILYGYLYDFRINRFGDNCESTWNINKIAATISCFVDYKNLTTKDLMISLYRRWLIYPLYRSLELWEKVKEDLLLTLTIGRKAILKWFIRIKKLNEKKESGYLINRIFINDLIVWIQQTSESSFSSILEDIANINISKAELNLNLLEIEEFANDCY